MALTLVEALQELQKRLGHDPDCGCDDCDLGREVDEQLASLQQS